MAVAVVANLIIKRENVFSLLKEMRRAINAARFKRNNFCYLSKINILMRDGII
jgi:hypothetical protein